MREKKRSRPEMRPVMLGTAVVLVLFLAGLLYLGVATWLQYKNSIIDKQKEQMLLITQAISETWSSISRRPRRIWRAFPLRRRSWMTPTWPREPESS